MLPYLGFATYLVFDIVLSCYVVGFVASISGKFPLCFVALD